MKASMPLSVAVRRIARQPRLARLRRGSLRAFTLVELMVTVFIIAVMAAVATSSSRTSATRATNYGRQLYAEMSRVRTGAVSGRCYKLTFSSARLLVEWGDTDNHDCDSSCVSSCSGTLVQDRVYEAPAGVSIWGATTADCSDTSVAVPGAPMSGTSVFWFLPDGTTVDGAGNATSFCVYTATSPGATTAVEGKSAFQVIYATGKAVSSSWE